MEGAFSVRFWVQAFISALIVMILIFVWKKFFSKVNVPVLSAVASDV